MKDYVPSQKILENYAKVLVNFALGSGRGVQKGETVYLTVNEYAKPLYVELYKAIIKRGGNVIQNYIPDDKETYDKQNSNVSRLFYQLASEEQLKFFPSKYLKGLIDEIDHSIYIISDTNKHLLKGIDPKKIMARGQAFKPYMDWRNHKENAGKFTWTLALYGTPAMAKEARMSLKEYWSEIIKACFLDKKDPIKEWKRVFKMVEKTQDKLNSMPIEKLHVKGPDADLWVHLGEKKKWMGGSGRNIPSFEIFTSPDWRGTNGWIRFSEPLYRYGNLITGVELWFKDGKVVKSKAKQNEKVLKEMIATKNADKIGEYSLTDKRFSRITKFMAETLFDENVGGKYGNTHLALGNAYHDCFTGDPSQMNEEDWEELGFNSSSVHTDIVSTTPRTVTAYMKDGTSKVIYKDGLFTFLK
ncbi:MAG TPA: aminopeptidase [Candidatus Paceibacterota bacterium]|nr:aminopeptidase [Candidatus Paceibacterota bacterium]